jgi:hypothetical protein
LPTTRSAHLDAHWRPHAGLEHDEARLDGLEPRRGGRAGQFRRLHDLVPDILRRANVIAPLAIWPAARVGNQLPVGIAREFAAATVVPEVDAPARIVGRVLGLVVDHRLEHRDRRGIERRLGAAELAGHQLDLRHRLDREILVLEHLEDLAHGRVRHGGRHPQERALVERRHELPPQAGKAVRRPAPGRAGAHRLRVDARTLRGGGNEAEDAVEAEPDRAAHDHQQ